MMNNKKILLIFPTNFLRRDMGCAYGAYIPVQMLKSMGFSIDLFSTNQNDDFSDFSTYNNENIIDKLYLVNIIKPSFSDRVKNKIKKILGIARVYYSNSSVSDVILKEFQEVIKSTHYDYIYVHYINWSDLFRYSDISPNTKLVFNMHDTDFIQYYFNWGTNLIGKRFEDELEALKYYHSFICVSHDEMMFWLKFFPDKKFYFFPPINQLKELPNDSKNIDVLYIGAYNPHNITAARWFLDEVCPFLPENISITFCGKFLSGLQPEYLKKIKDRNISTIDFADNIEMLYAKAKTVVVPLLGGTGIKIKTLEALSYSMPVVTTVFGADGLPDKYENGCLVSDKPDEFAAYIRRLLEDNDFYNSAKEKQNAYYMKYLSFERNLSIIKEIFHD